MTSTKIEQRTTEPEARESEALLISGCENCLAQCDQVLLILSQENFVDASGEGASIGAHIRHILDRFHCLFAGLPVASIDYDDRKRDREIEHNLEAARFALATVKRRVEQLAQQPSSNGLITVREAVLPAGPAVQIPSTLERELMSLITHSIHHLAVIVLIAKSFGHQIDDDLGKAPSTLVFERGESPAN